MTKRNSGRRKVKRPRDYDMIDSAAHLRLWKPLRSALRQSERVLLPVYLGSDQAALRTQWYHRRLTILAAVCGTAAVLFAILQLSGFVPARWPVWVEAVAAAIAVVAVRDKLKQLRHELVHEKDPVAAFEKMRACEWVLESEHREWLRLMVEAEWVG